MVLDRQSSGLGSTVKWCHIGIIMMKVKWRRLVFKWYGIDSQVVSHWQSCDESQVSTDWFSSGMGSTVKWCSISSLKKTVQVSMDWSSSGMGLTVKWCHIDSLMMKAKWRQIGFQVVKWCHIGSQVASDWQ